MERSSGIEALRLISMALILSLHVNYFVFGPPSATDFQIEPVCSFLRTALESLAIVGVNVFVLISGWFGIRPRIHRVASLLFQTSFFCCLLFVGGAAFGVPHSSSDVLGSLFLLGTHNWFLRSYLLLYALSPILESFAEKATKLTFRNTLIVFFAFQTVYGWMIPGLDFFEVFRKGYSPLSFFGLYLLARYARLYHPRFALRPRWLDLFQYVFLSLVTALASALQTTKMTSGIDFFAYNSPLVVTASVSLFLFFEKWAFSSRFINSVSRSSLSVYLFHMHPSICTPLFVPIAADILQSKTPRQLLIVPYLLLFFIIAILIDQIQIFLWNAFSRHRTQNNSPCTY